MNETFEADPSILVSIKEAIETAQYTLTTIQCQWENCVATANSWMSLHKHIDIMHCSHTTASRLSQDKRGAIYPCRWRQCNTHCIDLEQLYKHMLGTHLTKIELPCVISGCTQTVQSNYIRRHFWEQHRYPDTEEQLVPVQKALVVNRSMPRRGTIWYPSPEPPDTPLDDIPDRLLPRHEVLALTIKPSAKTLSGALKRPADGGEDPMRKPRWLREMDPETDVAFRGWRTGAGGSVDTPRGEGPDLAMLVEDAVVLRMPAADPRDMSSQLARIPYTQPVPRVGPQTEGPQPPLVAGIDSFRMQLNTAKMKNLLDRRGQFPHLSDDNVPPQ